jgi:hypothetical protein
MISYRLTIEHVFLHLWSETTVFASQKNVIDSCVRNM